MAKPSASAQDTSTPQPLRALRVDLIEGNEPPQPDEDRSVRIEALLERIQQTLDVQFQRMADMQAQLDRLLANERARS